MKLSSKGRYAVRALFDIAFYNEGRPTQVKDIADRQGIPPRFLEQIFQELKRAGIVGSKRGPQGGYLLAQSADAIRLGDVVRALEGPISLGAEEGSLESDALESNQRSPRTRGSEAAASPLPNGARRPRRDGPRAGGQGGQLATESVFRDLSLQVEACFDAVTVADVCARARQLGIKKPHPQGYVYVI